MTYEFIINTENVNEFYYRVLTDGIDYTQYMRNPVVLFMHEREFQKKTLIKFLNLVLPLKKEVGDWVFHSQNVLWKNTIVEK